jgi:hypothetical protein
MPDNVTEAGDGEEPDGEGDLSERLEEFQKFIEDVDPEDFR